MTKGFIKRVDLENRLHALCAAQRITAQDAIDIAILPAADVAPVRHGKWTLNKDGSGTCSECGRVQTSCWDIDNWDNFCHHCGADMRICGG